MVNQLQISSSSSNNQRVMLAVSNHPDEAVSSNDHQNGNQFAQLCVAIEGVSSKLDMYNRGNGRESQFPPKRGRDERGSGKNFEKNKIIVTEAVREAFNQFRAEAFLNT